MKMSKLNERLLLKSIKHWEEMREDPESSTPYWRNCPLCRHYLHTTAPLMQCDGCPVADKTERSGCEGTPWKKAADAWEYRTSLKGWRKAATAEIRFLRSLLPKKKGTK